MKTKAVRLYGKHDLRLEEFELPELQDDEILAQVMCDSICMSSYKATNLGKDHKRVPDNVHEKPVIIGHEFSGKIIEVGKKWQHQFKTGEKFCIQPALNYKGSLDAPGYSFQYIGGNATYIIIPNIVMELECLLKYNGAGYFPASLSEPLSCVIGAFHANFHVNPGSYIHNMGVKTGGKIALLAAAGPMGLAALDYVLHSDIKPSLLVVTDIDEDRLKSSQNKFNESYAKNKGIQLMYLNPNKYADPEKELMNLTENKGYDDVFVFAPVKSLIEQGDSLLARDGCLNFFAGPEDPEFKAPINFYNVHYNSTHFIATSGGNNDDLKESLDLIAENKFKPAVMVTHIGGLNAAIDTTKNLPGIPGGKKLIYTNIKLALTAISDFEKLASHDTFIKKLYDITQKNDGLWSVEAEEYLLKNADKI